MRPTPTALLVLVALALPGLARADALGPVAPVECPRGAYSTASGGGHGAFAFCAPAIAASDAGCAPGRRREILGLEIGTRHVSPAWDGRRGPMPEEMRALGTDLVVVTGTCEPAADAPVFDAGEIATLAHAPPPPDGTGTPPIPAGCQRVLCWVDDPSETCAPPPASAPPSPFVATPTPAPEGPAPSCACAAGASRAAPGHVALVALALAALTRASRRRASTHCSAESARSGREQR